MDYTLASGESVYYEAKYRRGIYLLCNISNRLQYTIHRRYDVTWAAKPAHATRHTRHYIAE
jgi:hypothetical protein